MRGYIRPLGWNLSYRAPNQSIKAFRHAFMHGLVDGAAQWDGQGALTDIQVLATADITNGHTITLVDGVGNVVTFEFRTSGSVTPGNVLVDISAAVTADDVRDEFDLAIGNDGTLQVLASHPIAATVTVEALYKSSHGNHNVSVGAFTGGLVAAQAASVNRFTVDDSTLRFGYEGPLAMPARLGLQRMIPTRTIPITGDGEDTNVD